MFPGEKFDRHKWNRLLSDLNHCIGEFLAVRRLQTDADLYRQALVDVFFEQENEDLFQQAVNASLPDTDDETYLEKTEDWQIRFRTRKRAMTYPLTNRLKLLPNAFDQLEDDLDRYYLISKLQFACNRASDARLLRDAEKKGYFTRLLEQSAYADPEGKSTLLGLYRALLELLLERDMDFATFFTLLQQQGPKVAGHEQEALVRLSMNYCIARYRQGNKKAIGWCRQLFLWVGQQKAASLAAAEELYLNLGVLLAKTKNFREFEVFLKTRKKIIPADRQEQAHNLLTAFYHFYREAFVSAAQALIRVDTRHPRYALLTHSLRVRNTYSLWRASLATLQTLHLDLQRFGEFLDRQKTFSEPVCQLYRELIWFIRKMGEAETNPAITAELLLKELNRRQPAVRDWVESMIDRLPG